MGTVSVRRRPFRVAEIFAVFAFSMLHQVTGDPCMDATFRGTGWRHRHVLLLSKITARWLLASDGLYLVLPSDGFFCSLARLLHRAGGLLASVAFPVG